jgi:hypothetical protein
MEEIMLRKFIVAIVAAIAMGGVALAQNVTPPSATPAPAYLIAHVQVSDPEGWKQYLAALPSLSR